MAKRESNKRANSTVDLNTIGLEMGRKPPQAIDVEEAVLGALLVEPECVTEIMDSLSPDCFYKEANKKIFKAILGLAQRHAPVDIYTVSNELSATGDLELIGGVHYLSQLSLRIGSATHVDYHAKVLLQ